MSELNTLYEKLKEEITNAHQPLYIFDDDVDGLSAFLLLYNHIKDGKGVALKASSCVDKKALPFVEKYPSDVIFVLDKSNMTQEFVDKAKQKIVWVDHHDPQQLNQVTYINPKLFNPTIHTSTTYECYKAIGGPLWIAMAGCLADWVIPDFLEQFQKEYPDLLPLENPTPSKALFETRMGLLVKILWFNLLGLPKDYKKSVLTLTRIKDPAEILDQTTAQGKFIYKRYATLEKEYQSLLKSVKVEKDDPIILFQYTEAKISFTAYLSNEILYKNPNKIIIIARKKDGSYKCSFRSSGTVTIKPLLEKALEGLDATGGGHDHACGAVIKEDDFEYVLNKIREQIS